MSKRLHSVLPNKRTSRSLRLWTSLSSPYPKFPLNLALPPRQRQKKIMGLNSGELIGWEYMLRIRLLCSAASRSNRFRLTMSLCMFPHSYCSRTHGSSFKHSDLIPTTPIPSHSNLIARHHLIHSQRAMDTIYRLNGTILAFSKDAQSRFQAATTGIMSEIDKVQVRRMILDS